MNWSTVSQTISLLSPSLGCQCSADDLYHGKFVFALHGHLRVNEQAIAHFASDVLRRTQQELNPAASACEPGVMTVQRDPQHVSDTSLEIDLVSALDAPVCNVGESILRSATPGARGCKPDVQSVAPTM